MRQISRYESPSQRRKRRRTVVALSILSVIVLLVLAPLVGSWLQLPYDLNVLHIAERTIKTVSATFRTPLTAASTTPIQTMKATSSPSGAAAETDDEAPTAEPTTSPLDIAEQRQTYVLEVTVNDDGSRLDVKEQIEFINPSNEPIEVIPLRIAPERAQTEAGDEGEFTWSRVIVDGQSCSFASDASDSSIIWVYLPTPLEPGQSARVSLAFFCAIPENGAAFGRSYRSVRLTNFYPIVAGFGPDGWLLDPPTNLPIPYYPAKGDYTVTLNAQTPDVITTTGQAVRQENGSWKIEAQNVRDFAIVYGDSRREESGENLYVSATRTAKATTLYETSLAILSFDAAILGPYTEQLDVFETSIERDSATHAGLVLVDVPDSPDAVAFPFQLALAINRLYFGSDIAGDTFAASLNELICRYLATQYLISTGVEADTAYDLSPAAKDMADFAATLPAGAFDTALREYRMAANGRVANPNWFGQDWDDSLQATFLAMVERHQADLVN